MKTNILKMKKYIPILLIFGIVAVLSTNCDKNINEEYFRTNKGLLIGEYLKAHSDTFGEFYKLLEKTKSVSFLNAYGIYTCFAPSNNAMKEFYQSKGKTSIDDFSTADDLDYLKQIVRYHLVGDTIATSMFTNGGLRDTTLSGDYLITSFDTGGLKTIKVNGIANVFLKDVNLVNGIVHGIDKVLNPVTLSVAKFIETDGKYNIFSEALKNTGLYDSLNIRSFRVTVFAETDSVFALDSIFSYSDLLKKYSQTGEPYLNPKDSLYLWIAYHCIHQTLFLTDLANVTYNNMTNSMLSTVTKKADILLNESPVNVQLSNNPTKNGVVHTLKKALTFVAVPVAIYWEITDQPELRALTEFWRKKKLTPIPGAQLPDGVKGITVAPGDYWDYNYATGFTYKDHFGYTFDAAKNRLWFEIETPPLVKGGTYKVWICGKNVTTNPRAMVDVYWDGTWVYRIDELGTEYTGTDEELEAIGRKLYLISRNKQYIGYLIGTFTMKDNGTHKIKAVRVTDGACTWDMIHFIPVNENQTAVKF
jgi:uncharacterized surface protein with fasciclin (FAS1) repeats